MGLIKSNVAPVSLTSFSMKSIEDQARAMLARAQQQADELLVAAQAEAEELKREATAQALVEGRKTGLAQGTDEGRKAGHQQALTESKAQLAQVVAALTKAAAEIDASRRRLEAEARGDVVRLAVSIAERVTKKFGQMDATVLGDNVAEAMKLVVRASDLRIGINPLQREALLAALPQLQIQWPALQHVGLVDDGSLAPGGCRIFTAGGQIDADLDGQIERIAMDLLPTSKRSTEADAS